MGKGLIKYHDWETRIAKFISNRISQKFEWGKNDCTLFVADAILAMTGTDLAEEYRDKYHSKESMEIFIENKTGMKDFLAIALKELKESGIQETHPKKAKRGMPVLLNMDNENYLVLGIMNLNGIEAIAVGEKGLCFYPFRNIIKAWEF